MVLKLAVMSFFFSSLFYVFIILSFYLYSPFFSWGGWGRGYGAEDGIFCTSIISPVLGNSGCLRRGKWNSVCQFLVTICGNIGEWNNSMQHSYSGSPADALISSTLQMQTA